MKVEFVDQVCQECGRDLSKAISILGEDTLELHRRVHQAELVEDTLRVLGEAVQETTITLRRLSHEGQANRLTAALKKAVSALRGEEENREEAQG